MFKFDSESVESFSFYLLFLFQFFSSTWYCHFPIFPWINHQFYLNPSSKLQYRFLFSASKMVLFCWWCDLIWRQPFHKQQWTCSNKFLTGIHFSTSFTSFTYLIANVMSLLRRVRMSAFAPLYIISIRRWWIGFSIWSSGVPPG